MIAYENIAYGLKVHKRPVHEIRERVDTLLADFGISSLKDRYPGSLSGGEQQRVAIARALATDPSVLLLDEPFASLDPRSRDECIRVMQELKESRSVTIMQVSHSGDEAYALADKVTVLIDGRIAQTGTPDEIFCHPASAEVAQVVGIENVLGCTVLNNGSGHSRITIGSATIRLPAEYQQGTQITIGIPAKYIRVVSRQPASGDQGMNSILCQVKRLTSGKDTATLKLEGEIPLTAVMHRTGDDGYIPGRGRRCLLSSESWISGSFQGADLSILSIIHVCINQECDKVMIRHRDYISAAHATTVPWCHFLPAYPDSISVFG